MPDELPSTEVPTPSVKSRNATKQPRVSARPLRGRSAAGSLFARLPAPMSPARVIRPSDGGRPPRSSRKRIAGSPTRPLAGKARRLENSPARNAGGSQPPARLAARMLVRSEDSRLCGSSAPPCVPAIDAGWPGRYAYPHERHHPGTPVEVTTNEGERYIFRR